MPLLCRVADPSPPLPSRACAAWHDVTGYKFTEIANLTSAFLQGPETNRESERELMQALQAGRHTKMRILNYSKSGEPFFNTLECFPLRDQVGQLTHFCGVLRSESAGAEYARRTSPPCAGASTRRYPPPPSFCA